MPGTDLRSRTAAPCAANLARTAARLEDLDFLIRTGEDPGNALARIGWTPAAAQRAAYRNGRLDLAHAVGPTLHAQRSSRERALRYV